MRKVFIYGDPARNTDGKVKVPVEEKEEKIDVGKVKEIKPFTHADGTLLVDYANIPRTLNGVSKDLFLYKILPYLSFREVFQFRISKNYPDFVRQFPFQMNLLFGPEWSRGFNGQEDSGGVLSLPKEKKRELKYKYKEILRILYFLNFLSLNDKISLMQTNTSWREMILRNSAFVEQLKRAKRAVQQIDEIPFIYIDSGPADRFSRKERTLLHRQILSNSNSK